MEQIEKELRALANLRRLEILTYLKKSREACVIDISEEIKKAYKATSKHLNILFARDILSRKQVGTEMRYRLQINTSPLVVSVVKFL